jgi:hypothetical protein
LEILYSIKDRKLVDAHSQHLVDRETRGLEDILKNMYLNVEPRVGSEPESEGEAMDSSAS